MRRLSNLKMLSRDEIVHLAELARIRLTEEEIERFGRELPSVLSFIEKLKEVKTEEIDPVIGGTFLSNVMREDAPFPPLGEAKALRGSFIKKDERGNLVVPKIFNHESR